jgi:hypothetical protein
MNSIDLNMSWSICGFQISSFHVQWALGITPFSKIVPYAH